MSVNAGYVGASEPIGEKELGGLDEVGLDTLDCDCTEAGMLRKSVRLVPELILALVSLGVVTTSGMSKSWKRLLEAGFEGGKGEDVRAEADDAGAESIHPLIESVDLTCDALFPDAEAPDRSMSMREVTETVGVSGEMACGEIWAEGGGEGEALACRAGLGAKKPNETTDEGGFGEAMYGELLAGIGVAEMVGDGDTRSGMSGVNRPSDLASLLRLLLGLDWTIDVAGVMGVASIRCAEPLACGLTLRPTRSSKRDWPLRCGFITSKWPAWMFAVCATVAGLSGRLYASLYGSSTKSSAMPAGRGGKGGVLSRVGPVLSGLAFLFGSWKGLWLWEFAAGAEPGCSTKGLLCW